MPAAPLSFIAKFKVNQYQLLIKNGFDNSSQTFVVDFDSKLEDLVKQPEDIIGYKFDKWSLEVPETMPANDLELTAEFIPLEFKLLIKDSIGNIVLDKLVPFDEDLSSIIMDPPTIAGFEFESKVGTIPDKMPNEDLEIIFNYVEVFEYRLLIVGINEEILLDRLIRENESLSSIILPNLGGNPGFDFTGWDNQLPETMPSSDLIIKATGNLRLASLSLYDENGTLINIFEGMVGSSVNLPNPIRIGYNFAGWLTQNNQVVNINVMPNGNNILRASWTPKIYTILVTVGSNDFNISLKFGEPIGNIVSPQLFGFRFEGWKNNLTGEFLNSNTIFTTPEEINLIPVFTRLNAAETLVAATRLISDFILRLFR
jgi:uncharacterized repeat protein (TIGR02543 family)